MSYPDLLRQRSTDGGNSAIQKKVEEMCVSGKPTFRIVASEAILNRYPFGNDVNGQCIEFESIQISQNLVQFLKIFLNRTRCRNGVYQEALTKFWEWIVVNHRRLVEDDVIRDQFLRVIVANIFRSQVAWHDYFAPKFQTAEVLLTRADRQLYLFKYSQIVNYIVKTEQNFVRVSLNHLNINQYVKSIVFPRIQNILFVQIENLDLPNIHDGFELTIDKQHLCHINNPLSFVSDIVVKLYPRIDEIKIRLGRVEMNHVQQKECFDWLMQHEFEYAGQNRFKHFAPTVSVFVTINEDDFFENFMSVIIETRQRTFF